MSFDTTKYKDWYWCESSGLYNDYFREIEGAEELPIEFAKEVIDDCDDLIPIDGKPNHYHKLTGGYYIDFIDYAIYAFKDKTVFQQVVTKFENYFNIQKLFNIHKISESDFLSYSKGKQIDKKPIIECAYDMANWILDIDEDYGIARISCSLKRYLEVSLKLLELIEGYQQLVIF